MLPQLVLSVVVGDIYVIYVSPLLSHRATKSPCTYIHTQTHTRSAPNAFFTILTTSKYYIFEAPPAFTNNNERWSTENCPLLYHQQQRSSKQVTTTCSRLFSVALTESSTTTIIINIMFFTVLYSSRAAVYAISLDFSMKNVSKHYTYIRTLSLV